MVKQKGKLKMKTGNIIYGYCRCSTSEELQDIDRQIRELRAVGVREEHIYKEYESGTKKDRIEFNRLMEVVCPGDTIAATEVSRISRSTAHLCEIIEEAKLKKIRLLLGGFTVDCREGHIDAMTEGMLKMMAVFAEMERNIISERVKSGMANAKEKGAVIGRPKTNIEDVPQKFKQHYELYKKGKINKSDLSKLTELSRPTVNKYIKIMENEVEK